VSNTKTNWLRIFNEILARYSENPIKHAIALCEENAYFFHVEIHDIHKKNRSSQIPETISPRGTKFCREAHSICESSVWKLHYVSILAHRILTFRSYIYFSNLCTCVIIAFYLRRGSKKFRATHYLAVCLYYPRSFVG